MLYNIDIYITLDRLTDFDLTIRSNFISVLYTCEMESVGESGV